MKRLFLLLVLLCAFSFVGCQSENVNNEETINEKIEKENEESNVNENGLKNPIMKWWQLYNPNGFNTLTAVLSNPNDCDIDINYVLVYYKDGVEVARASETCANYNISPDHDEVLWLNYEVPDSKDVDEIRMENLYVTKAEYDSIDSEIEYVKTENGKAYYNVSCEEDPYMNTIYALEYNDDNNNKKCDKGELLAVNVQSVMEKEQTISIDMNVYNPNSLELYYNAY